MRYNEFPYSDIDKWSNGGFPKSECQLFGETDGCKSFCPVFGRGECENELEVKEMIKQGIID